MVIQWSSGGLEFFARLVTCQIKAGAKALVTLRISEERSGNIGSQKYVSDAALLAD